MALFVFFPHISRVFCAGVFFGGWGGGLPSFLSTIVVRKPRNCSARFLLLFFFSFSFYHYSITNQFASKRLKNRLY